MSSPRFFHGGQQPGKHPDVAHANPGAAQRVDPGLVAEYVYEHRRRHAHGQGKHPAPFGIRGQALGENANLRDFQHQEEDDLEKGEPRQREIRCVFQQKRLLKAVASQKRHGADGKMKAAAAEDDIAENPCAVGVGIAGSAFCKQPVYAE